MFHVYFECMVFTCWIILSKSHIRSSFRQHFSFSKSIWAVLLCSTARAPFFTNDTFIMTSSRLHFYVPPLYLNKLAWSLCLGGIWHFTLCISHLIPTVKLSTQQALPWTLKKQTEHIHFSRSERPKRRWEIETLSMSNPNTIILVIIHYYFNDRGLGLKVTSLHYRLLPHISNSGCPNF